MYTFNEYNLNIESDFEIKVFKDMEHDFDLIIPLNDRTLNFNSSCEHICSRMQFNGIESILIRACKDNNTIGTIHFLKDKGIHSTICNFEFDYFNKKLVILLKDFVVEMNFFKNLNPKKAR